MKTIIPWILMSALGVFGLTNCSSDEDDDDNGGGSSGTSAGKGGTGGKGGSGGAGKGGSAGSAGTAGKGGSAGSMGDAGEAGSLGTAGSGAGAPGEGGAAGDLGTAGDGTGPGAGAGGVAGSDGGMAGAGGDDAGDALTDARILHVIITVNNGEVAEGQLALTRATDPSVVSFADEMVMEHGSANTEANTLATEQAITPETNPISEALAQQSSETVAELTAVDAAAFDVAYMESQVTAHTEVIALIEDQLLPEAENAALITFLGDIRDHVEAHLFDAETTLEGL
jgi:predicted outer membrane protein